MSTFYDAVRRIALLLVFQGVCVILFAPCYSPSLVAQSPVEALSSPSRRSTVSVDNLGIRYLKLGNSYREARNYDLAQTYLKRGLEMVRNRSPYWEAVGYEYLGLLYRDMGDRQMALEYLRTASSLYDRVISMRNNQGSDEVLRSIIADVEQGVSSTLRSEQPTTTTDLREENRRLQEENRALQAKINELETRIRQLESAMNINPGMSLKSPMSVDMSDCKRDLEGIARYRESTLWLNGFTPIDFSTQDVRITGGGARVDGTVIVGYLKRGESAKIDINIPIGQYIIIADGCAPKARDIDVRIINQQGVVLEKKDIRFTGSMPNPAPSNATSTTTNEYRSESDGQTQSSSTTRSSDTPSQQPDDVFRNRPSSNREALAKIAWNNEYGGIHTFLVTMYECDSEGAYFCLLIGKK
ncbi:MAG: tetratricopeptide repeat protein [Bacteroidota bacterium]|nr:tetratricopeptide repeat protein [Candidatus Kapabacteria bacterium]MDW8220415.1 tetratricopeptide repeat protein [Bacteroidota bacterium]